MAKIIALVLLPVLHWYRHPHYAGAITLVMLASLARLASRCNGVLVALVALALLPKLHWH
jgi:hypothetical protein